MDKNATENEKLNLFTTQNSTKRTNCFKAKIDHTGVNSMCKLCDAGTKGIKWRRLSNRNCTRNWNLTIQKNCICTNQNLS